MVCNSICWCIPEMDPANNCLMIFADILLPKWHQPSITIMLTILQTYKYIIVHINNVMQHIYISHYSLWTMSQIDLKHFGKWIWKYFFRRGMDYTTRVHSFSIFEKNDHIVRGKNYTSIFLVSFFKNPMFSKSTYCNMGCLLQTIWTKLAVKNANFSRMTITSFIILNLSFMSTYICIITKAKCHCSSYLTSNLLYLLISILQWVLFQENLCMFQCQSIILFYHQLHYN